MFVSFSIVDKNFRRLELVDLGAESLHTHMWKRLTFVITVKLVVRRNGWLTITYLSANVTVVTFLISTDDWLKVDLKMTRFEIFTGCNFTADFESDVKTIPSFSLLIPRGYVGIFSLAFSISISICTRFFYVNLWKCNVTWFVLRHVDANTTDRRQREFNFEPSSSISPFHSSSFRLKDNEKYYNATAKLPQTGKSSDGQL